MAYRKIELSFWQDDFVLDLTQEEKFFYLYLMCNSKTTQLGCYEIPRKIMNVETGWNYEMIEKMLERFKKFGKIDYDSDTGEIAILNWHKYNWTQSPKVRACILKDLEKIKSVHLRRIFDKLCTAHGYITNPENTPMDTYPNREREEKEEEEEEEKEKEETQETVAANPLNPKPTMEQFDQFWDAYPKKKARQNAWKAFQKLSGDPSFFAKLMKSLALQKRQKEWQKEDGQYIPYPASWLNAGQWDDDVNISNMATPVAIAAKTKTQSDIERRRQEMGLGGGDSYA